MSSITTRCGGSCVSLGWFFGICAALTLGVCALVRADDPADNFQPADLSSSFDNGRNSVIPCEFYLGGILIPISTPDKKQAFLLFDTGANEPMLSAAFADEMRIRSTPSFSASGVGGNLATGSTTAGITFSLPGITFHHARWATLPNIAFDAEFGRPVVGILGMDVLKDFVIRIDYIGHTLEFAKPGNFPPPRGFVTLPFTMGDHGPMITATVHSEGKSAAVPFLLDTGYNGALELTRPFQDENPGLKFTPFARDGERGVVGDVMTEDAVCPALVLGGMTLERPPLTLDQVATTAGPGVVNTIGNEIWRRFDVILDQPRRKLYLRKNAQFGDSFSNISAGMLVLASGDHYQTLTIHEILPGSAGDRAGFLPGDVVVSVAELNGVAPTIANVYPLSHQPGTYHFAVRRDEQTLQVTLELKNPEAP